LLRYSPGIEFDGESVEAVEASRRELDRRVLWLLADVLGVDG
jgi:hypothetical protein